MRFGLLKKLRNEEFKKKILWIICLVIILSFGVFGSAYVLVGLGPAGHAGKIFGRNVTLDEFNRVYQIMYVQALLRYGENFENVKDYLNLEAQTWDRLILLHDAEKKGISASNEEVVQTIESFPYFQRNGQFDTLVYNDVLRFAFKIKPRSFEEGMRDNIKISKLFEKQTSDIMLPEQEILDAYIKKNEKVQVSYVLASPDKFKNESAFDEEKAKQYYETNKISFIIPSTVNVEYTVVPFEKKSGEESNVSDPAWTKAETLKQELGTNPNFSEVAKKNSLDLKETGFFSLEEPNLSLGWPLDVLNQVFKLQPDAISGPYETSEGLVFMKLKEKKESYLPPYEEVAAKVKDAFLKEEAKAVTQQKAQEYASLIQEKFKQSSFPEFSKIAQELKLEIFQTPLFNRGQYLPQIGISQDFEEAAFNLKNSETKLSGVIQTAKGYCILHLDNYTPADTSKFNEEKEDIKATLLAEKKNRAFGEYLTNLRLQSRLVDNIPELQKQNQ